MLMSVMTSVAGAANESPAGLARSLSVTQAEALWLKANPELLLARSAVAMSEANRLTADRRNNPQLSWGATSINPRTGIGSGSLKDKAVDQVLRVEQLIERGDKRTLRTRVAEALTGAAARDAEDIARQGRIQLYAAYWDLHKAEERERVSAASAQLAKETVLAAEKRVKAGDLARADLARLQVESLRAENDARAAQADRQKAQTELAYLIGLSREAGSLQTSDDWPPLVVAPPVTQLNIEQRPDVLAARARLAAAEVALDAARALSNRDVTLGVQYERFPPAGSASPNNTWGLSLSVPLFVAHTYEGEAARAAAELDAAREQLERSRALAAGEIMRSHAELAAATERRRRIDSELLPAAETVANAAEFAYSKGAINLIDLIDARRTLRQVQLDAANSRADYAKALATARFQNFTVSESR